MSGRRGVAGIVGMVAGATPYNKKSLTAPGIEPLQARNLHLQLSPESSRNSGDYRIKIRVQLLTRLF